MEGGNINKNQDQIGVITTNQLLQSKSAKTSPLKKQFNSPTKFVQDNLDMVNPKAESK